MWQTNLNSREIARVREQPVREIQVAVSNWWRAGVTILNGRNHLNEKVLGSLFGEVADREQFLLQVTAAGELHHQKRGIFRPVHRRVQHLPDSRTVSTFKTSLTKQYHLLTVVFYAAVQIVLSLASPKKQTIRIQRLPLKSEIHTSQP